MVKTKRKKRKPKVSDEWKKLRKQHLKGPKRVKIRDPRKKNGVDPLLVPANTKKIQIWVSEGLSKKVPVSIVLFNRAFDQLGLHKNITLNMRRDDLKRCGKSLEATFDMFSYNERVQGTFIKKRLAGIVGRCVIFSEEFKSPPDATINVLLSLKEETRLKKAREYVESLFSDRQEPIRGPRTDNYEYI